jgi:hypothetical protein
LKIISFKEKTKRGEAELSGTVIFVLFNQNSIFLQTVHHDTLILSLPPASSNILRLHLVGGTKCIFAHHLLKPSTPHYEIPRDPISNPGRGPNAIPHYLTE